MKETYTCTGKSVHDANSKDPLIVVAFSKVGGIGTLHEYLKPDEAKAYELGAKYELTLTAAS